MHRLLPLILFGLTPTTATIAASAFMGEAQAMQCLIMHAYEGGGGWDGGGNCDGGGDSGGISAD